MEHAKNPLHLLILIPFLFLSPASAAPLFILGDSTTNCGDNTPLFPFLPPNLTSLCLDPNHRLIPLLIADRMGLPSIPLFHARNFTTEVLIHGVNFGSSPATIIAREGSGNGGGGLMALLGQGLSQQVAQARDVLQMISLDLGLGKGREVIRGSVFLLSFGTDDYVDLFMRGGPEAVGLKYGRRGIGRFLVNQMVRAIKDLYNADVRKIIYMGVGPLGCSPRIVLEGLQTLQHKSCVDEVNEVVSGYNSKIADGVLKLNKEFPELQIVFCDTYRGIMEIISNPSTYGMNDVRNACCGFGPLGAMIGCLNAEMACQDPSTHIWWDLYATTQAVNTLVANWSWLPPDPHFQICSPIPLQQLVSS